MRHDPDSLRDLLPYASPGQARIIEAIIEAGSFRAGAKALKIGERTVSAAVAATRKKAALKGLSPEHDMVHTVPDGFSVKGVSTLYGADGGLKVQWVKSRADDERREAIMREAFEAFADELPRYKPGAAPKRGDADHLPVYVIGDAHIGMYSWQEETGQDFDLSIAARELCGAVDRLVNSAPATDAALILNTGDYFHSDTSANVTLRSNNALDVDTRWAKVLQVGIRALRRCVESALTKHKTVHIVNVAGNHDDHTSIFLSIALAAFYEKDPRVKVDLSPAAYHYFVFGSNLIGMTHTHKKPEALGPIMATDRPEAWGAAKHRFWYLGHVHHRRVVELPGCVVESFRTLAARDAWHAAEGYRAGRDMTCIVLHARHGEVERHRVDVGMIDYGR